MTGFALELWWKLRWYEKETRLLVKLASTGHIVRVLGRFARKVEGCKQVFGMAEDENWASWKEELERERKERVEFFQALIDDDARLDAEMGDEQQQMEALTLLKYDLKKGRRDLLTPLECDLISSAYERVVRRSGLVVVSLPKWFVPSREFVGGAEQGSVYFDHSPVVSDDKDASFFFPEELCLRQAAIWVDLHHPHTLVEEHLLGKGCLSGLGLIYLPQVGNDFATSEASKHVENDDESSGVRRASVASDVLAFGMSMVKALAKRKGITDVASIEQALGRAASNPHPDIVNEKEWDLLVGMLSPHSEQRLAMADVVLQLEVLAMSEMPVREPELEEVADVCSYKYASADRTLAEMLMDLKEWCPSETNESEMDRQVYDRLKQILEHLQKKTEPVSVTVLDDFGRIVLRLLEVLERRDDGSKLNSYWAGTLAGTRNQFHFAIDRLIGSCPFLHDKVPVRHWQQKWENAFRLFQQDMPSFMENVHSEEDRAEAAIYLQFEANKRRGAHSSDKVRAIDAALTKIRQLSSSALQPLPPWFLPPYEVQVGKHIADGGFGSVSHGKWFGTDVVVKQLLQARIDKASFYHEADIWSRLNHPNVIKMYGACHEGPRPFFVCERAGNGTLGSFMKKWRLPWIVWASLHQAALGLQYLHHNGVVHGDLKGNNILVGTAGETKLSDFGLSVRTKGLESGEGERVVGAFRWKAPECLKKSAKSSFEADIYSFGMCIVEAVTGKFPWGNTMDDEAVRHCVMKGEMLQRPVGFQDEEWALVARLICVDPVDRLTVDALVNVLKEFKYAAIGRIQQAENQLDGFLAVRRHDAVRATAVDKLIDFGAGLWQELQVYEDSRPLVKLASTGRVNHLLERWRSRLVSLVKSVGALEEVTLELWTTVLHDDRACRMGIAQRTLLIPSRLEYEMGDEAQQEEALTLLKHCCENYRGALMPMELEVIVEVYDQMTRLSAFSLDCLLRDSRLGTALLSGLGLVEQLHEDRPGFGYTERSALVASNVCAFGLTIFALRENNTIHSVPLREYTDLPNVKPDFLKDDEWNLLLGMCADDPGKRANMAEITHTMKILAQDEENEGHSSNEMLDLPTESVEDVKTYICGVTGGTIEELLDEVGETCEEVEELASVYRPVYHRLVDIYQQLEAVPGSLPAALVEDFSAIVYKAFNKLNRHFVGDSLASTRCDACTIADRNFGLHRDIDRLIRSTPILEQTASIHSWQPVAAASTKHLSLLLDQLESEDERTEALTLLLIEAQYHSGLLMESEGAEGGRLDVLLGDVLPLWFIPPYQVKLGPHVADGSFASVYVGEWLGADVIVKQLLGAEMGMEFRNHFLQELGLWFALNHPNLIRMYGACHEGRRPFFVCERAQLGTLTSFAKGKRRSLVWRFLCQAAEGLAHLHELGIIHADLKGNNILVCENYGKPIAKLADFGLSFYAGTASTEDEGALGAFRWKAPECLLGEAPSFESDMYSFGMCILEALSGEYPWGSSIPDEVVRSRVTREKQLPSRPKILGEDEWGLIKRMCCFEPSNRITDPELMEALNDINFRSSWKNLSQ
ncbi:hypothetical protein BBJ28_00010429 [Nothophytophthora sp. Chile5]|nr:hypothetical protein BBJ28_00010429 [Nothophytophthora sp. Chile5]